MQNLPDMNLRMTSQVGDYEGRVAKFSGLQIDIISHLQNFLGISWSRGAINKFVGGILAPTPARFKLLPKLMCQSCIVEAHQMIHIIMI